MSLKKPTAQEHLGVQKARFDTVMDSLLAALPRSETLFAAALGDLPAITEDYSQALLEAAKIAPQEVGEDYEKAGRELQAHVVFLITVLGEHIQRRR